jgi:hypothetical protein
MKYLLVDLNNKLDLSSSNSDFQVKLYETIKKESCVSLINAQIPNTFYVFINKSITFNEGAGSVTASINNGSYSSSELSSHLQTQLNAAGLSTDYTVSYSSITMKFTINKAAGTFSLEMSADNTPYNELGFSNIDTGLATSHSASNIANLYGNTFFAINLGSAFENNVQITNGKSFDYILPNMINRNEINQYSQINLQTQSKKTDKDFNYLSVKIKDLNGNIIDFNGSHIQLLFTYY